MYNFEKIINIPVYEANAAKFINNDFFISCISTVVLYYQYIYS